MKSKHAVHFSSGKDDWQTPPELFDALDAEFGFVIDAAASRANTLCRVWFGPGSMNKDALKADWSPYASIWCNPPYSRGLQKKFVAKAVQEIARARNEDREMVIVMLLPARTDTKLFHGYLLPFAGINSHLPGIAWAAGIVDGEGCIGCYPSKGHFYPRLTVNNTDKPMLEKLLQVLHCGHLRAVTVRPPNRPQWVWEANSSEAVEALMLLYPHLVTKKPQAHLLLSSQQDYAAIAERLSELKRLQSRPQPSVEIRFLKGRLKFVGAEHGAPFPSMVVVLRSY